MKCPECGYQLGGDEIVCPNCLARLPDSTASPTTPATAASAPRYVTAPGAPKSKSTRRLSPTALRTLLAVSLGLAIVERVAAAHGGAVDIRSAPGEGATVEIWLPGQERMRDA